MMYILYTFEKSTVIKKKYSSAIELKCLLLCATVMDILLSFTN